MINRGIFYFVIGSFIGWIFEIIFKTIAREDRSRAGMANCPFCILYGIGTCFMALSIYKFANNILLIFLFSSITLTTLEYITGIFLENIYGIELWDYGKLKFGLNKHISLEFIIIWGFLGVLFVKYILPILNRIYYSLNSPVLYVTIYVVLIYIIIDYTNINIKMLNKK